MIDIGSNWELFVDDYIVDKISENVKAQLHRPVPGEIVLVLDKPWEGNGCKYFSVFKDRDVYKMYYHALHYDVKGKNMRVHEPFACYAESKDGIHWEKPDIGLVEFDGSRKNNIILKPGMIEGTDPAHTTFFMDENPDIPDDERYKALSVFWDKEKRGLLALCSKDGINWRLMKKEPVITKGDFDSENLAFWDDSIKKYRAYWRYFTGGTMGKGYRAIRTSTSSDFFNWDEPKDLCYNPQRPEEHLYTNQIKSYFRANHILIGFPARYLERGWNFSMEKLPDYENRKLRSEINNRYGMALTDTLFMTSRDGVCFKIWDDAFLVPGPERYGSWGYGDHHIAWHPVETKSSENLEEISFYVNEGFWVSNGITIRRYTLRPDGFVSLGCGIKGGEIITKPFIFKGKKLYLNFSTSAAGSIKIEFQDLNNRAIEGFEMDSCPEIYGDSIKREVVFNSGKDFSQLSGKPVRLRFYLKEAELYAFGFSD